MKFAFPILTAAGEEFKDVKALTALINGEKSGHYLLGNHNKWHGGIHISDQPPGARISIPSGRLPMAR